MHMASGSTILVGGPEQKAATYRAESGKSKTPQGSAEACYNN